MQNWTNARLCDVANLILGAFLFVSPWIFGFGAGMTSQNATVAKASIVRPRFSLRTFGRHALPPRV